MKGHLIIAGGNVINNDIYMKFVELAGEDNEKIAIVPTAAEDPEDALVKYTKLFQKFGISDDKIIGIRVGPDIKCDSAWKNNGDDFENLDFLQDVKGVWFTGGDQIRIVRGFLREDGSDTDLLKKIKNILQSGGVIGGSSAGAAVMSDIMIGGGTSFGALSTVECRNYNEYRDRPELEKDGVLLITKGLGFFKHGIVDQHFDKRSRIGRLLEIMFSEGINFGYGISEDTAIVYNIDQGQIEIVGTGGVTLVDISEASRNKVKKYSEITNVKIGFINAGEVYNISDKSVEEDPRDNLYCSEYNTYRNFLTNILYSSNGDFDHFIGDKSILDSMELLFYSNDKKMHYIKNYHFLNRDIGYEIQLYSKRNNSNVVVKKNNVFINAIIDMLPVLFDNEI